MATMIGGDFSKIYGLQPMTFEEELAAPENIKRTRRNKIALVDLCNNMRHMINQIEFNAKLTPEVDNDHHSGLVEEYTELVRKASKDLDEVFMWVYNKAR